MVETWSSPLQLFASINILTDREIALLEAYYSILPALEKECLLNYNAMACHDRILDIVIDVSNSRINLNFTAVFLILFLNSECGIFLIGVKKIAQNC